jgi:hypothetical protein
MKKIILVLFLSFLFNSNTSAFTDKDLISIKVSCRGNAESGSNKFEWFDDYSFNFGRFYVPNEKGYLTFSAVDLENCSHCMGRDKFYLEGSMTEIQKSSAIIGNNTILLKQVIPKVNTDAKITISSGNFSSIDKLSSLTLYRTGTCTNIDKVVAKNNELKKTSGTKDTLKKIIGK